MTGSGTSFAALLREVASTLHLYGSALAERAAGNLRSEHHPYRPQFASRRSLWAKRCVIGTGVVAFAAIVSCGIVWMQLSSGAISIGFMTPWLTSAIEERLGSGHRVEVGGTILERDETGRSALRLRDIVVRDAHGTIVASAPKAEVGLAGLGLLTGRVQADRLSLIGAALSLRIDAGGQVDILTEPASAAGAPITGSVAIAGVAHASERPGLPTVEVTADPLAAVLAWIDRLDSLGLDGGALAEIGLKDGTLIVDDQRHGKRWTFEHINLSLTRPQEGGVAFAVNSTGADGLWSLTATVTPKPDGKRTIETVIRDVSPKDLMLALRAGDSHFAADAPLSAVLRADIERDGTLQSLEGRVLAGAGYFGSRTDAESRIHIDDAQLNLRWNATTRRLEMPLEARSGPSRVAFMAELAVPAAAGAPLTLTVARGLVVLASADRSQDPPLIIDRVTVSARIDPVKRRFEVDQADLGGMAGGFAISGAIDYSSPDPHLALGIAGTRMTVSAFKRLWPALVTPRLRAWVVERVIGGTVEKVVIATNAALSAFEPGGPPVPDDGLSMEVVSTGNTIRPVDGLPVMRDADMMTRVQGRTATVRVGRATVDLPSGRKLTLSNGVFEVPDTHPKPSPMRTRFRAEGTADAAAELLSLERLKDSANVVLDPATTKGNFVAQVALDYTLTLTGALSKDNLDYQIDADLTNFVAEKWVRGQKVEAAALKLMANSQGFYTRGDVRIGGLPATVDYRKPAGDRDAEVRIQAVLDDAGRAKLGLGMNEMVSGPVPFRLTGRVGSEDRESRYQIEADLKDSKISELLPGWWKASGKATKVTFTAIDKPQIMRFDDIVIEGPGTLVKGMIELDANNEITLASFPTFALSDGDKATLRADRATDGTLKVTMRGELFDGRGFLKSATSSSSSDKTRPSRDFDLDVKLATVTGYNVEALRGVELRLSRRNGHLRTFGMIARLGNASLMGDLRAYPGGRKVVYLESSDAGAMLRFTDMYSRVIGGQMWIAIDPPTGDQNPQEGVINVRDFSIRGETQLERVAANDSDPGRVSQNNFGAGVSFARMRAEFTKSPGKLSVRDGVVWGPVMGATIEGQFDYTRDAVNMRGTFVPAYALNNFLARVPIVGFFLGGGQNEGIFGMTYEIVGPTGNATLRVNPVSMMAPGFLRKIFEFRNADDSKQVPPYASPTR